jgi:GntR family transcriptional regulator / MocR family aminotransferase
MPGLHVAQVRRSISARHLVAYLAAGQRDIEIEAAAARAGLVVRAISRFYRKAPARSGLMLGFSGYPRPLIVPAAARLATLIAQKRVKKVSANGYHLEE